MFLRIDAQKLFRQILKKILIFAYVINFCYFVISLIFEKQFQDMMNKFKIEPIRVNYTPACSALTHADRMSSIAQVLGHRFTGNQSQVVT